tara:strand:+ start:339 stop:1736 length:1398 start_codon:yes stop_codon:yes gene_type:complete
MKKTITIMMVLLMMVISSVIVIGALGIGTTDLAALIVRNATEFTVNDEGFNLVNQRPDPAEPGGYVELRLKVENVGADEAKAVLFELLPEFPFSLVEGQDVQQNLGSIGGRQVGEEAYIVYYKLKVDEDAVEGKNRIRFKFSKDNGRSWILLDSYYIRIQTDDAILVIDEVKTNPAQVSPGEVSKLQLSVRNMADSLLKELTFQLDLDDVPFAPIDSSNEKTLFQLTNEEEAVLEFKLMAQVDADSKVHKVPMTITYTDEIGQNYTKDVNIGIVVNDAPEFIINLDETDIYTRNSKGNIIISISNIGSSEIQYLTTELLPSEDYEVLSRQKVYLGNLDSDDFDSAEYELYMKSKKKSVPLLLEVTYKDSFNTEFVKEIEVNMPLYSSSEAKKFGIGKQSSMVGSIINLMFLSVLTVFWLFMVMEALKIPMKRYEKILWMILVVLGYVLGAAIFYFMKKRRKKKND